MNRIGVIGMLLIIKAMLNSTVFRNAIASRYGKLANDSPKLCSCGQSNPLSHDLSCKHSFLPSISHNCIREYLANIITSVSPCVEIKQVLQSLSPDVCSQHPSGILDIYIGPAILMVVCDAVSGGTNSLYVIKRCNSKRTDSKNTRNGGLGIRNYAIDTKLEYSRSLRICHPFLTMF
ncbi:hypothetical protein GJ496_002643 [Pomphorhynchus laevis]|nr:hypothetical protein GJ496_002643 [Pomphorhynchus laevis]